MTNTQNIISHAEKQCKAHGARLSDKRKQVLTGLLESTKALSAYELVDYCKENFGNSIPAMSIYRILDFLEKQSFVHKLSLANKYVACKHIACDHIHQISQFLICKQCQQVSEINMSQAGIKEIETSVKQAGYKLVDPKFEINCICNHCSANTAQVTPSRL